VFNNAHPQIPMRTRIIPLLLLLSLSISANAMTLAERKAYLAKFVQTLPQVPSFNDWLKSSGALPPDFDALPKNNGLPDPLKFLSGKPVKTEADWQMRRAEILRLFEKYEVGTIPPKPKLDSVTPVDPASIPPPTTGTNPAMARAFGGGPAPAGSITKIVDLHYGPKDQITTRVTLVLPAGKGPFPVLIGGNPPIAARGYISCQFPNSVDAPPDIAKYYPGFDWGSMGKVAWTTEMVVDYLYTLPEVDKKCIALTGYSRAGKRALLTAAIEPRITAVVPGSTGVGGVMAWRDGSERGFGESIESTTRTYPIWFAPQLRFFAGREDRLPVDGNLMVALVAPRPCLIKWGDNDEVSQPWEMEHSYRSALRVYQFLGKADALATLHTPGTHMSGLNSDQMLDWLDIQFGRSTKPWPEPLTFTYNFDDWKKASGETIDISKYPAHKTNEDLLAGGIKTTAQWEARADDVRKSVNWMLGEKNPNPPSVASTSSTFDPEKFAITSHPGSCGWLQPQAGQTASRRVTFANGVTGDLYYPANAPGTKLPAVIWLHGYSYSLGYMWVYRNDLHPILALVRAGYAVLAFDQSGFGARMNESPVRYQLNPNWSQLGQMIDGTRAGIDTLQKDALVDPAKIYLYGYSMGGMLALYTAALDSRVKGVVSICGFTPMRGDTAAKGAGGLARYAIDHETLPRAGFFIGHETHVPYDFDALIASIAPRPVYIVQPTLDRDANIADVDAAIARAAKVFALYGSGENLKLDEPWDYNRLPDVTQDRAIAWMKGTLK
jgi:dienelactone hydrolase